MMRIVMVFAALATLVGCGSAPRERPQQVGIPVAVGCLGDLPARPISHYGVGPWPGDKAAAQAALGDANAWEQYATSLEGAIAGCSPRGKPLAPAAAENLLMP